MCAACGASTVRSGSLWELSKTQPKFLVAYTGHCLCDVSGAWMKPARESEGVL